MSPIFVFAYYSYKDPVFQSAVLPYFTSSSFKKVVLLTWEQKQYALSRQEIKEIKKALQQKEIVWYRVQWHSGRFKLLKKAFDFITGVFLSFLLIVKYKVELIYSEGFPGAIIAHFISILSFRPHVIHTFEPHADYMVEAGVWTKSSWEYRLLKYFEVPIANHAKVIITATKAYKKVLKERGVSTEILVLPSCIDTDFYDYQPNSREKIRRELNIRDNQIVITYLGKLGGMYMEEELFEFFGQCLQYDPHKFYFFLFTEIGNDRLKGVLNEYNIPESVILCKYLSKSEVPAYLSASDIGFCGVRPIQSQRYSSPIKNGEYWACGLPVIIPKGVSGDYLIIQENDDLGFIIEFDKEKGFAFCKIIPKLFEKLSINKNQIVKATRKIAIEKRDINQGRRVIHKLLLK